MKGMLIGVVLTAVMGMGSLIAVNAAATQAPAPTLGCAFGGGC